MGRIELSKNDRALLARRYWQDQLRSWGWKLVGLFLAFVMAGGAILLQRFAQQRGYSLDGKVIFVPLILAIPAFIAMRKPTASPQDKVALVLAERREKWMAGLLLVTVLLGLFFAVVCLIQGSTLSISALLLPMVAMTQLFALMGRQDEGTQAMSATSLRGGFLAGFACMSALAAAAIYAPAITAQIMPLAIAAPIATSALIYLGLTWRSAETMSD